MLPQPKTEKAGTSAFCQKGSRSLPPANAKPSLAEFCATQKAVLTHSTHWVLHLVVGHPATQRVQHVETGFRV